MLFSVNLVLFAPPVISNVWFNFLAITLDLSAPCASSPAYFMPSSVVATSCLLLFVFVYDTSHAVLLRFTVNAVLTVSTFNSKTVFAVFTIEADGPSLPLITTAEPSLPFTPILPSTPSLPSLPSLPTLMSLENAYMISLFYQLHYRYAMSIN